MTMMYFFQLSQKCMQKLNICCVYFACTFPVHLHVMYICISCVNEFPIQLNLKPKETCNLIAEIRECFSYINI